MRLLDGQTRGQLVSSLAWGPHVWFLDEPEHVMRLEDLPERVDG